MLLRTLAWPLWNFRALCLFDRRGRTAWSVIRRQTASFDVWAARWYVRYIYLQEAGSNCNIGMSEPMQPWARDLANSVRHDAALVIIEVASARSDGRGRVAQFAVLLPDELVHAREFHSLTLGRSLWP